MISHIETTRLEFYDTTLRDGAQTVGVRYTSDEKRTIIADLDRLGVDFIECGWPGANPTDDALFRDPPQVTRSALVAFGMTRQNGRTCDEDPTIQNLRNARINNVCLVAKSSKRHVQEALSNTSCHNNLEMIDASIGYLKRYKQKVFLDAEHFFDGYKLDRTYALSCLQAAYKAGADRIVLCDTNGSVLPSEVSAILVEVAKTIPMKNLGVHFHNDLGLADAASLLSAEIGVRQIQGTMLGLGERCGNANLTTLIPLIAFKSRLHTNLDPARLTELPSITNSIAAKADVKVERNAPFVGRDAFTHKAGLHASAVQKSNTLYEHIDPSYVGRRSKTTLSSQAGLSNLRMYLDRLGFSVCHNDQRLQAILNEIKRRECSGENVELNTGSIDLLIAETLFGSAPPLLPATFHVEDIATENFRESRAKVELVVREGLIRVQAEAKGIGSVDALSDAIDQAVTQVFPEEPHFTLLDFSANLSSEITGSKSVVNVCLKAAGADTGHWKVTASSGDVLTASWKALILCANRHLVFRQLPRRSSIEDAAHENATEILRVPCLGVCAASASFENGKVNLISEQQGISYA